MSTSTTLSVRWEKWRSSNGSGNGDGEISVSTAYTSDKYSKVSQWQRSLCLPLDCIYDYWVTTDSDRTIGIVMRDDCKYHIKDEDLGIFYRSKSIVNTAPKIELKYLQKESDASKESKLVVILSTEPDEKSILFVHKCGNRKVLYKRQGDAHEEQLPIDEKLPLFNFDDIYDSLSSENNVKPEVSEAKLIFPGQGLKKDITLTVVSRVAYGLYSTAADYV